MSISSGPSQEWFPSPAFPANFAPRGCKGYSWISQVQVIKMVIKRKLDRLHRLHDMTGWMWLNLSAFQGTSSWYPETILWWRLVLRSVNTLKALQSSQKGQTSDKTRRCSTPRSGIAPPSVDQPRCPQLKLVARPSSVGKRGRHQNPLVRFSNCSVDSEHLQHGKRRLDPLLRHLAQELKV